MPCRSLCLPLRMPLTHAFFPTRSMRPENIHDGYFSIDKKGKSVESKNKEGENEERGFDLIMKDKERLLSQS